MARNDKLINPTETGRPMKALSIRQPWAWLIANGHKNIENRDWRYLPKIRGPIAIHAAKGCTRDEYEDAVHFARTIDRSIVVPPLKELERGGIVATCNFSGCVTESIDPWFVGRVGLILEDVEPVAFMECKGQLGFFDVELHSATTA